MKPECVEDTTVYRLVFVLDAVVRNGTLVNLRCQCHLFVIQSDRCFSQRLLHTPIFINKASREEIRIFILAESCLTNIQFGRIVYSAMFLRSVGSRFSIQRGALLLRRVPVRAATGARPAVVEENGGDTSLVGCVYLRTSLRNSTPKNETHSTDEGLSRVIPLFVDKNASTKHLGQGENHGSWNKQKNMSSSEQGSAFGQLAIEPSWISNKGLKFWQHSRL